MAARRVHTAARVRRVVEVPAGVDGGVLVTEEFGDPDDQPVIFLHGGGQNRWTWEKTALTIAPEGYMVVTVDMKGHGDSYWEVWSVLVRTGMYSHASPREARARLGIHGVTSTPPQHTAVRELLLHHQDLNRLLKLRFPDRRPAVVGASLGGLTVLMSRGTDPCAVSSSVLVDITPRMEVQGMARIVSFMQRTAEMGFKSLEEAAEAVSGYLKHRRERKPSGRGSKGQGLESLRKVLRQKDDGLWRWHWDPLFLGGAKAVFAQPLDNPDVAAEAARLQEQSREEYSKGAARLRTPCLVLRGRQSDLVSEAGVEEFLGVVKHAEYADIAKARHMIAGDRNDVFCDEVLKFLNRHYPRHPTTGRRRPDTPAPPRARRKSRSGFGSESGSGSGSGSGLGSGTGGGGPSIGAGGGTVVISSRL